MTLKAQYRLCDRVFVHTDKMKQELIDEFGVAETAVTVIPYGINNAVPNTSLTSADAKKHFGIDPDDKTLLAFGNIGPYKGLEYLAAGIRPAAREGSELSASRGWHAQAWRVSLLAAGRGSGWSRTFAADACC